MAAQSKFTEVWSGLPPWAKGLAVVGILSVATVTGFKIYGYYKNKKQIKASGGMAVDDAGQDLGKLQQSGIVASYLGTQYALWADQIQAALDYCGIVSDGTTDQQVVLNIFDQMRNAADVLQLVQSFGVREQHPCWYAHPINTITSMFSKYQGGLGNWLQQSLTTDMFASINTKLRARGINFTFQ